MTTHLLLISVGLPILACCEPNIVLKIKTKQFGVHNR
jgi:hypothetical protein